MNTILLLALLAQGPGNDLAPEHAGNAVLSTLMAHGVRAGGAAVMLTTPTFRDGQTADAQRAALREIAGSDRAAEQLLRDSVTAPFVLKLRDVEGESATLRAGDLYFVVHTDLDALDATDLAGASDSGANAVEAGNMRFGARVLSADDLAGTDVVPPADGGQIIHAESRLLDRIAVESTSHLVATRSAGSLIVASQTDPRFGTDGRWPNRWATVDRRTGAIGRAEPYAGGAGYAKITPLAGLPGCLIVEIHFAFAEPNAWFDGAPALRSKLGLVTQDAIRRLRRRLAEESQRNER